MVGPGAARRLDGAARRIDAGIDCAAEALRAGAPWFTRRNLLFAVRRASAAAGDGGVDESTFSASLKRRLARGALLGLLGSGRRRMTPRPDSRATMAPDIVLLVDRPSTMDLLLALDVEAALGVAVVCADGEPAARVSALARAFRAGQSAGVLYLHDAATVLYPFALEPVATLVTSSADDEPVPYLDAGLPPLGAPARRFAGSGLPADEVVLEVEALPPAVLLRHCGEAAAQLRRDLTRRAGRRKGT